jgi:soluble lytic murein transglycosylase-like protein
MLKKYNSSILLKELISYHAFKFAKAFSLNANNMQKGFNMNKKTVTCSIIASLFLTLFITSSTEDEYQFKNTENKRIIKSQKDVLSKNEKHLLVYDKIILKTSERHNVDPALIKAIIMAESSAETHAISKKGATGLMQIMPKTARSLGVKNSAYPAQNIEAGTKYLKCLMDEYDGNIKLALAAYNAGPGSVKRYKGIPPYKETRSYIKKVLAYYNACRYKTDT